MLYTPCCHPLHKIVDRTPTCTLRPCCHPLHKIAGVSKPRLEHATIPEGGRARDQHELLGNANAGANLGGASAQEGAEDEEGTESGDEDGEKEAGEEGSDDNWGDAAGLGPGAPG